eukprot:1158330-Pelagomonas_calceolata.AAC.5
MASEETSNSKQIFLFQSMLTIWISSNCNERGLGCMKGPCPSLCALEGIASSVQILLLALAGTAKYRLPSHALKYLAADPKQTVAWRFDLRCV